MQERRWRLITKQRLKALIADSDPDAPDKYKRFPVWRECGFEIAGYAASDKGAAMYIKNTAVDLIVYREKPPEMKAAVFLSSLAKGSKAPPCAVISGSADTMRECFLSGAIDHITEPLTEQQLKETLLRAAGIINSCKAASEYCAAAEEYFSELEFPPENESFFKTLENFIYDNEGIIVSTEDAASYFGFNKDYFGRLFRQRTGITFGEFYKRLRIRYAEKLLLTGRYKVNEVGKMLGFSTSDYFTSEFRKYTGKRPIDVKSRK